MTNGGDQGDIASRGEKLLLDKKRDERLRS